ncbi:DUF559 domain-containing protein [Fulvivirga sp. 29W222]|uniref:DUF559 domain-containing protein n=1 Tax=Fulvivirga marina TaxID=2494733 RepID=A0A937G1S5_9BACT|nr:endonuclease domain-containing protein [Fulvivirga marina]MBL6448478.1 DUF559 domain-containing protein [Fulvivirga marina]
MNNLHSGASGNDFRNAKENRQQLTFAEQLLWMQLRNRRLKGFKFRRQHPISAFIIDFYCHQCLLAIEVDGGYHEDPQQMEYDIERTRVLEELGVHVVRFSNDEVVKKMSWVLEEIGKHLIPSPSPQGEGSKSSP